MQPSQTVGKKNWLLHTGISLHLGINIMSKVSGVSRKSKLNGYKYLCKNISN